MSDPAAALRAIIAAAGDHVVALLERVEERLAAVVAAHGTALDGHAGQTIAAGGKRLRPLLVLLAAGSSPRDEARLVRGAVAVELVHSATLVHDDVLDEASLRRGRPTVVAAAGPGMATATGDLLFARAFAELAAPGGLLEGVRALSAAASALARGELRQREEAWAANVSVDRYLERCELKTACLFQAACELGALEGPRDQAEALGAFGRRVGVAFQILDDVLDVGGQAERTGKHRGTDLLDGTVTLPLILARARDPWVAALDLRSLTSAHEAEAVCDLITATGALDESRARALAMVAAAKGGLPDLPARQRRALELVADAVVERYG